METIVLDNDIKVFYITAASFPAGIMDAHKQLHERVPFLAGRRYFGISRPENGTIVYRAAAEESTPEEAEQLNCGTLLLKKGKYISRVIDDYMNDISRVEKVFKQLLSYPGLDPEGYCVEWYFNDKDLRCMIKLMN